ASATVADEAPTPSTLRRLTPLFSQVADSVDTPRPAGSIATASSSLAVLRYRRGATTGWRPLWKTSERRLYSTPSYGAAIAYRLIGSSLPPTVFQLVMRPR